MCYNIYIEKEEAFMKEIKINTEYITLGQFLKFVAIIDSGAYAKTFLLENDVFVNGEKEERRGRKLYPDYEIEVIGEKFKVK